MEPRITCLDSVQLDFAPLPEEVAVEEVVAFNTSCLAWDTGERTKLRRVQRVESTEEGQQFWVAGDSSYFEDECLIQYDDIVGLVVTTQKNVYPENTALRDSVLDALEIYDSAISEHEDAVDDYEDTRDDYNAILEEAAEADAEAQQAAVQHEEFCVRYTKVLGVCVLSPQLRIQQRLELIMRIAEALERADEADERAGDLRSLVDDNEDRALEAGEIAEDALILYECWLGVAATSEYPGHIPDHECPAPE